MSNSSQATFSDEVTQAYRTAYLRVTAPAAARPYWDRVLLPEQRRRLGRDFRTAVTKHGNPVNFLLAIDGRISGEQAALDVAHSLGFLSDRDHAWLLREIVGQPRLEPPSPHPEWNRDMGKLTWEGELIRKVNVRPNSNIAQILNAFQDNNWPDAIDDPVQGSMNSQARFDAIRALNRGLEKLRFRSNGMGQIIWELI